jgi:hypothetical protein
MKFTNCSTRSLGPPGRSLATCTIAKTLRKYIKSPVQTPARRQGTSKIDPFKTAVAGLLEQDQRASAVVILQRLRPLGYDGGITICGPVSATSRRWTSLSPLPSSRGHVWSGMGPPPQKVNNLAPFGRNWLE